MKKQRHIIRTLSVLVLAIMVLASCRKNNPAGIVSASQGVIEGHQTIGDTDYFHDLVVKSGARLTVAGRRVRIAGDLRVEENASIEGAWERLDLIIEGDLVLDGEVSSAGHLVMASHDSLVPSVLEPDSADAENRMEVVDGAGPPPANRSDWVIRGRFAAGSSAAPGVAPSLAPNFAFAPPKGKKGKAGASAMLSVVGNLTVAPPPAAPIRIQRSGNGGRGEDKSGCGVVAGDGGRGGDLRIDVMSGRLRIINTAFVGGNGGNGGNATGAGCADGANNRGGIGGQPGKIKIVVQRLGIMTSGYDMQNVSFSGWNGGDGGKAAISGVVGDHAAGAAVVATGGDGAIISRSLNVGMGVGITPPVIFDIGSAGDGGDAQATGGNGADAPADSVGEWGHFCAAVDGGRGGDARALGGKGADVLVQFSIPPSVILAGFWAGDGAAATANGGDGGDGGDCLGNGIGGAGGDGGNASGIAGAAGKSTPPWPLGPRNGVAGIRNAVGGDGGNGGCVGGAPGSGGSGPDGNGADGASCF